MEIHNKADSVVDFDGVPAAMCFWTRFNGCLGEPETTKISDILAQLQYCEGPAEVMLLYFDDDSDDFGHHWPRTKFYGFEATQPIWESFSRHKLEEDLTKDRTDNEPDDERSDALPRDFQKEDVLPADCSDCP